MNEIIIKEVDFNKKKIKAILKEGKIYVGIKNIAQNLGMNENQINTQRQKIQKDFTLKKGCVNFHAGVFDSNNATLGIELNFLPLWLAKINPVHFSEELKNALFSYQLWAKDILADAFFGKREKELPLLPEDKDWGIKRIHDRVDQAKEIEKQIYYLIKFLEPIYEEIEGIAKLKKDSVFREFKNFKTDESYDASKEQLPFVTNKKISNI